LFTSVQLRRNVSVFSARFLQPSDIESLHYRARCLTVTVFFYLKGFWCVRFPEHANKMRLGANVFFDWKLQTKHYEHPLKQSPLYASHQHRGEYDPVCFRKHAFHQWRKFGRRECSVVKGKWTLVKCGLRSVIANECQAPLMIFHMLLLPGRPIARIISLLRRTRRFVSWLWPQPSPVLTMHIREGIDKLSGLRS